MSPVVLGWVPAGVLALGGLLTLGATTQKAMPLREPLEAVVPVEMEGMTGQDIAISEEEQRVAGMSDYLMRVYAPAGGEATGSPDQFSLYVGYYESQTQGKTIHSPKNCLPGAGWEALTSSTVPVATAAGAVEVNRYLLQNGEQRALVLYWYQGRGRIQSSEYAVKWDLLRDTALRGRSDEALVRVIVPVVGGDEAAAEATAVQVAIQAIPAVDRALPE